MPHHHETAEGPQDVPTWTNVLITDYMPIRWATEPGTPDPGDELTGHLVIGTEEQLTIDLSGTTATRLLAVLLSVHQGADAGFSWPVPSGG